MPHIQGQRPQQSQVLDLLRLSRSRCCAPVMISGQEHKVTVYNSHSEAVVLCRVSSVVSDTVRTHMDMCSCLTPPDPPRSLSARRNHG